MKSVNAEKRYCDYLNEKIGKLVSELVEIRLLEEETKSYVTQAQAFKKFGRSNVERWLRKSKSRVKTYCRSMRASGRPQIIEYKMLDLLEAAKNEQDYLYNK